MKSIRMMIPALAFVGMFAIAGCSGQTGSASGESNSATQAESDGVTTTDASNRPQGFHGPHGGGPESLVFASLHETINLTDAQKTTIQALVAANAPKAPPAPDKARIAALAAAIRSGNLDNLPAPSDADHAAERQAHLTTAATELTTLHSTLTKDQRTALVNAVLAKMANGPGGHGGGDGKGGPPHDHGHDGDAHGGPGGPGGGPMHGLLADLNLTADQQTAIKAKLDAQRPSDADRDAMQAKFEAMKADHEAKLKTFVNDDFDATAFVTPPDRASAGPGGPGHHPNELAIIVPILTPAQRETLAQKIEAGPPAHGPGGHGPDQGPPPGN